ncbi:S-adenosyl-L-methionine-dependent methyltransferase [Trichoderma sp. SZMC 28014]
MRRRTPIFRPSKKSLEWLVSHLPRVGCKVLDKGCGTGRPVALALSRPPHHHQVHGIDVSENMLSVARLSVPSASFELTDVRVFQSDSESFDAVTSYFALLVDISQDEIRQIMQNIFTWLRPGGLLVFSTIPADVEHYAQSWLGRRAIFSSLSEEQYLALLEQLGRFCCRILSCGEFHA